MLVSNPEVFLIAFMRLTGLDASYAFGGVSSAFMRHTGLVGLNAVSASSCFTGLLELMLAFFGINVGLLSNFFTGLLELTLACCVDLLFGVQYCVDLLFGLQYSFLAIAFS
jgi:hypothetical protein